jgi:putative N6-adenine-specific DNA methylase
VAEALNTYTVTTLFGLEETLMEELRQIGAQDITALNRAVSFTGDQRTMYLANLWLRTALKVLKPIHKFTAATEEELYNGVKQIDWAKYMDVDDTLAIESAVNSDFFNHSQYVALKSKDAIVDQFRNRYGKRPNVSVIDPSLRIHIHIFRDQCTISLDSSGDSLHKRGYRLENPIAPLNEVLAAGLISLSGWKGETNFIDPMCGSGTIVIEAGLIAKNVAPGLLRTKFGFQSWLDYDEDLWLQLKAEAEEQQKEITVEIIGSDLATGPVTIARSNVERAGLDEDIRISRRPIEEQDPPQGGGVMIINPPYGERLEMEDITAFYKMVGDTMKKKYAGYEVWILSSNKDAIKSIGLRTSKRLTLFNGPLECKFHNFSIYAGSKRVDKGEE